ncbi:hypothetical protein SCB49_13930 [unidentified eubacterium SCB49]|nr:hypothetical protein SCB49_13930 [unidentified eubacterium SCB49]
MAINPATAGWINKYISLLPIRFDEMPPLSQKEVYHLLVKTGFFYGVSSELAVLQLVKNNIFSIDDYTKVNLFTALILTYRQEHPKNNIEDALIAIEKFYKLNNKGRKGLFSRINFSKQTATNVEAILSARLQESNPIIKKGSSSFFTYILLSIDIIAFYDYLKEPNDTAQAYAELEYIYNKLSFLALSAKIKKTKHDTNILALFKETFSATATDDVIIKNELIKLPIVIQENEILQNQLINLCLLAIFDDKEIDTAELAFLYKLIEELNVIEFNISENINDLYQFKDGYGKVLQLFTSANPVKHFYKESTRTVKVLITKNADRIIKELAESKELVRLMGQSTLRELNEEEKKKVKDQLLDICKTIPSLTIFIIPGGSLLLPLLIKLIPQLLPSAFDENRIKK